MKKKLKIITSDDILGKEAVDPEGSILGVITKVHIDKKTLKVIGITIDMGLLKPDLFVGSRYIKFFGIDAVLLKKVPHDKYKGLKVLTEGGEVIGRVKNIVVSDRKKIKEFVISTKRIWDKHYKITYKDIKEIGDHIILKEKSKPKKKK
jgi:sporulation protein YlmC with PRC-barrel domain